MIMENEALDIISIFLVIITLIAMYKRLKKI